MDRREFIGALSAGLISRGESEAKNTPPTLEQQERIQEVKDFGVTGEKLPLFVKTAIKGLPKQYELDTYQVVFINDYDKFLDKNALVKDLGSREAQIRKLLKLREAEVVNGKFPIYINGESQTIQQLIKDPHGLEVLKSFLIHERTHAVQTELPHSEVYKLQYEYLGEQFKKGKLPIKYQGVLEKIKQKMQHYAAIEKREKGENQQVASNRL